MLFRLYLCQRCSIPQDDIADVNDNSQRDDKHCVDATQDDSKAVPAKCQKALSTWSLMAKVLPHHKSF
jgi:hypothetical protein